jgi:hypothetical protein
MRLFKFEWAGGTFWFAAAALRAFVAYNGESGFIYTTEI